MSLRLRLVVTLGVTLLALWGITAAWLIRDLSTQFEQSLDRRLAQSARMVAGLMERVPADAWRGDTGEIPVIPALEGVACRVSSLRGQVVAGTHPELNDVLSTRVAGYGYRRHDGQRWRVYTLTDENRRITVADRMRERESLLGQVRRAASYPFLLALSGSLVALWWGVTRGLTPLARLQRRLAQRDHDDLSALPTRGLPGEIRPLIDGFNTLLARTRRTLEREQRFTDDAAHELRTPLTAVRTHLQVARRVDGDRRREAMRQAEAGVVRLTRTLEQLLLLARMDNDAGHDDLEPARLDEALETALTETGSHGRCRLDGVDASLCIAMPVTLLVTVLRNLIGNARHHGDPHQPIEVAARRRDAGIVIEIVNQGAIIPPERLANLTDRFYRGNHPRGSGLGLSIVKALVERFGGALTLASSRETPFRVRLWLPEGQG